MAIDREPLEPRAADRQRAPKVLAAFALVITLAGGAAAVSTACYLVSRTSASSGEKQALDRQIAEARENLATAAPPTKTASA